MLLVLLLLLPGLKSEDPSPASGRPAKNINNVWYEPVTFRLKEKTTKQGPVLFPNDGPPTPPTPLIVTSRPLIESIRRSELNPNNTIQDRASSQLNQVTFRPNYLDSDKEGNNFVYVPKPSPVYQFVNVPFEDLQARRQPNDKLLQGYVDNSEDYSSYYDTNQIGRDTANHYTQQRSTLPPIYKAFADHANSELNRQKKLDTLQKTKPVYEHQPRYENIRENQNLGEANSQEYNNGENYAFSYRVKDRQTGDDFSHSQRSSGSATNGEYRVRLPDGRMQIVSYTADEGGYKAEVRYDDDDTNKNKIEPEPVKVNQYQNDYIDRYLDNNRYTKYNENNVNVNVPAIKNNYKIDDSFNVDYYNKADDRDTINNNDHTPDYLLTDHDTDKLDNDYKFVSNIDYDRNSKQSNVPDYYQYSDEIVKDPIDYSSENLSYQPHKSKYSLYNPNSGIKSTVTPAYEDIKHLFTTPNPAIGISATGNPYSTIEPFDSRTENVVVIGTKKPLFTHIRNILGIGSVTANPLSYSTQAPPAVSSPSSYLYSTISNLKNKIELAKKPILSQEYINKINKYLQFN